MSNYLPPQGELLKLHLLTLLDKEPLFGLEIVRLLKKRYAPYNYNIKHEYVYKALNDLVTDGLLYKTSTVKNGFQKVTLYHYTDKGKNEAEKFKKKMKFELDRSIGLLQEAVKANYG